jgi:galactonate dehydratase
MVMATDHRRARLQLKLAPQTAAAVKSASSNLDISEIVLFRVHEPGLGREYSILRVKTRSGLIGYGECARASKEDLAAAQQFWVGRPATSYAIAANDLPLAGAMDMALLDIVGKACKAPVYRVLGGPTRNKARAFTSVSAGGEAETAAGLKMAADHGYRAFGLRVPSPASRNQGRAYEISVHGLADLVRAQGGDFIMEGGDQLTPGDAASVATTIQPLHPLWFDEPCGISNLQTLHKIADECVVPLGFGRDIRIAGGFQDLLRSGLVDVVRPDLLHFGITRTRRIAAMAETYYVAVAPRHEGGPIATAAALHLAASLANFFIQQIPLSTAAEDRAMRAALAGQNVETVKDGFASLPEGPGLGITVNESALEKYHVA